jgi:hypothetical protein
MASIQAIDHAFPNGNGTTSAADAGAGGMTNNEKAAVSGLLARDENKGAAIHVRYSELDDEHELITGS